MLVWNPAVQNIVAFDCDWIDLTRYLLMLSLLLGLFDCSKEPDDAASIAECKAKSFPSLKSENLQQCIQACIKCEHGVMTTCATSCTLKGAAQRREGAREGGDAR